MFYMDSTGQVVLGDPADKGKKGRAPKPAKAAKTASSVEMPAIGEELTGLVSGLPKPVKIIGALVIVLVAAYAMGLRVPKFGPPKMPEDLLGRSGYVAEFVFAENNAGRLSRLAAPGTEDAARQWLQKLRPSFNYTGPQRQGNMLLITGAIEKDDGQTGLVMVNITPPNPEIKRELRDAPGTYAGYRVNGNFAFALHWKKVDGNWMLDGTETLKAAEQPVPEPLPAPRATTTRRR